MLAIFGISIRLAIANLQSAIASRPTLARILAMAVCIIEPANQGIANEADPKSPAAEAGDSTEVAVQSIHQLNLRAVELYHAGKLSEAEKLLLQAIELGRDRLDVKHPHALVTLKNYGTVLNEMGRSQEAIKILATVVQLRREVNGETDVLTLDATIQFTKALARIGELDRAEKQLEPVLEIGRETLGENSDVYLGALDSYAQVVDLQGRANEAVLLRSEHLLGSRAAYGDRDSRTIASLRKMASALGHAGRLSEARTISEQALNLTLDTKGSSHPVTIESLNNHAALLVRMGQLTDAEPLLIDASVSAQRVLGKRHPLTLSILNNLAFVLERLGRLTDAEMKFAEILVLRREILGLSHHETLSSLHNYGSLLGLMGKIEEAEGAMLEALRLRRGVLGDLHPDTLMTASNLAYLYLKTGQKFDQANDMALLAALGLRKRREMLGHDPQDTDQLKREQHNQSDYLKLAVDAGWSATVVQQRMDSAHLQNSFLLLQDILAGSASRAIAQSAARRAAELSSGLGGLARNRQDLADQWVLLERQLTAMAGGQGKDAEATRGELRENIAIVEAKMVEIDQQLRAEAPEFFSIMRPDALSVKEASELLRNDEAAIMLVPTEFGTHIMLLTDDSVTWRRSGATEKQIELAVTRLLWDVGADTGVSPALADRWETEGEGAYPFDFRTAKALYDHLVLPVEEQLEGKSHVFVMASGPLSKLPLGVLVAEASEGQNGDPDVLRSAKWLADRFALIQIPSLQSIQFLRNFRETDNGEKRKPFLGFGNPALEGSSALRGGRSSRNHDAASVRGFSTLYSEGPSRAGKTTVNVERLRKMSSLPGTKAELEAMWSAFGRPRNALFLSEAATEPAIRQADLSAEVIAFATHGLMAGEIGSAAEPGLVLSPPTVASNDNDGYLSMTEIAELKIDADWVILSACNTAADDGGTDAGGLSGMARSFFYAGARNLLVSYWPVRDDVAARLTVRTIEIAKDQPELTRAQAFQKAMKEVRDDKSADGEFDTWAHPNAWAPFMLVGDRR